MDMAANCVAVQKSPYEILVTMSCAVAWSVPAIRTASSAPHRDALRLLSSAWCECGFSAVLRGLLSAQVRGSHASPYQKKRNADKGPRPPIKNNTFSERGVCGGAMAPSKLRSLRRPSQLFSGCGDCCAACVAAGPAWHLPFGGASMYLQEGGEGKVVSHASTSRFGFSDRLLFSALCMRESSAFHLQKMQVTSNMHWHASAEARRNT